MRLALHRLTTLDRISARAERIGSAMEVWGGSDLRPLLERGRRASRRAAPGLRGMLADLVDRRRATAGGLRAH
jgi:hypothetical protein